MGGQQRDHAELRDEGARDTVPEEPAKHHSVVDHCKLLCKVREKQPWAPEPAALQGPISSSSGEKTARGGETQGKAGTGASTSSSAPSQGTGRRGWSLHGGLRHS